MTLQFMVHALPKNTIITNRRSKANPDGEARNQEQSEITRLTRDALIAKCGDTLPEFDRASVSLTYQCRKTGSDGKYRPRSAVWAIGGSILEGVCRPIAELGVVKDFIGIGFARDYVESEDDEGLFVTIEDFS